MCGIAGIINLTNKEQYSNAISLMTESLKHRGPDDEGYMVYSKKAETFYGNDSIVKDSNHIKTCYNHDFKVSFGFRQLKIIDLSIKSHQPMTENSQKYWIIFNGELYNYKEIKHQLKGLGHQFYSESDTEVVLIAYKEWGEKALQKFNGMFSFALLDTVKNNVFIARDRVGIKPLYFYKNNHHFIFGSNVKSIINSTLYIPEVNWKGLWQNYRFSTAQRPNTVYQDIIALEPGHHLTISLNDNSIEKKQYWEIPIQTQDFTLTEKQSKNILEESLYNAISYRLISDVEVGTFMSGGIDSSLISVLASKNKPDIKALTLGFKEDRELNEVSQAKDTAKLHQLNHIVHYANITEVLKDVNRAVIAYEEPYYHLSANLVLAKMASTNNIKVVLSGLGGDELFGGYDVYNKLSLWKKLKENKNLIQILPEINQKIKKGKQIANCETLGEYYSHYYTNFNDTEIDSLFRSESFNTKSTLETLYSPKKEFTDNFEAMSFFNLKSYIGNHQMRALDTTTMSFSIEGRFPLLDHNFIETAFKIPTKYKLKNSVQKYILKEVARKYIHKNTLRMQKKGLSLPLKKWIKTDLNDFVLDTIAQLERRQIFNNKAIDTIKKLDNHTKIWQLVSTEIWLQNFIDKK